MAGVASYIYYVEINSHAHLRIYTNQIFNKISFIWLFNILFTLCVVPSTNYTLENFFSPFSTCRKKHASCISILLHVQILRTIFPCFYGLFFGHLGQNAAIMLFFKDIMWSSINLCLCVCVSACVHVYVYVWVCVHACMHLCVRMCVCMCVTDAMIQFSKTHPVSAAGWL